MSSTRCCGRTYDYSNRASPKRNSSVKNNTAVQGGGIFNFDGQLTLDNSSVTDNTATQDGGGIYEDGGTAALNDSVVKNNTPDNVS